MKKLLLCSQSQTRQKLLKQSGIPFQLIANSADESQCCWSNELQQVVIDIASHKMAHAIIPSEHVSSVVYLLTADTLGQKENGGILGQPKDRAQAREYIRESQGTRLCATAFCLERRERFGKEWVTTERHIECVTSQLYFNVPDERIESYIDNTNALYASGAICIEGYGSQFVQSVTGSYTAICGLPLYELCVALKKARFNADH